MGSIKLDVDGQLAVVTLDEGENRFNPDFLAAFLQVLDQVEGETDCRSLVVTSSHEKIFCNGIDLQWLGSVVMQQDLDAAKAFFYQLNVLLRRLSTYPLITVAAINGHVFAGGAIMSCAFDFRFMRSDRGYFCLPEVDLGIPFLPGMNAILSKAIPRHTLELMQLTGKRMTAQECETSHIITQACSLEELMPTALAFAKPLSKGRAIVGELKARLTTGIVHAIDVLDVDYIESGQFQYPDA